MTLSPDVVAASRKLRPWAVVQVMESEYPHIYRLACGLAGRADVGRGIARYVLGRSVKMMPRWDPNDDPRNWFYHFTILMARRAVGHSPEVKTDLLVEKAGPAEVEYLAFVAALRALPRQQLEAFLLHHGERLNPRYSALAMDCSTEAAMTHLAAAVETLRSVAGAGRLDALVQRMVSAYAKLTPDEKLVMPSVNRTMLRHYWPRRIWRMIRLVVQLTILAAMACGAWWVYRHVRI